MSKSLVAAVLCSFLIVPMAFAGPKGAPPPPPNDEAKMADKKEDREAMMKKVHTGFILELAQELELDTTGAIKLADRLKKFEDQRISIRSEMLETHQALKQMKESKGTGDAATLAKKMAANRVKMAQIDQQELDEVLSGLSAEKAAKVALFSMEFAHRLGKMAHGGPRGDHGGRGGHGGPDGEPKHEKHDKKEK